MTVDRSKCGSRVLCLVFITKGFINSIFNLIIELQNFLRYGSALLKKQFYHQTENAASSGFQR